MQGKTIWILMFALFISVLTAVDAVALSVFFGIESVIPVWLIGGTVPVYLYLTISIVVTLVLLGMTSHQIISQLSNKTLLTDIAEKVTKIDKVQNEQQALLDALKAQIFLVDEGLNANRNTIIEKFTQQEKTMEQSHSALTSKIDEEMLLMRNRLGKQVTDGFNQQTLSLKELQTGLNNEFETKLKDVTDALNKRIGKAENGKVSGSQKDQIANINARLVRLETEMVTPKPLVTGQSDPEKVRGISTSIKEELKAMGITTTEQFILADPKVISTRSMISESLAEKLQGVAQISMVPSVKDTDLVLLEEVGIRDRQDLATQKPLELAKKVNDVFSSCVQKGAIAERDKPAIEEMYAWVKNAKA